jgi:hypothetical protein
MSEKIIRQLIETRLKVWAAARVPALPVAVENNALAVPTSIYLRMSLLRAPTVSKSLEGEHRARVGICQVSIVCINGTGADVGDGIAGELDLLFPNNLRLTQGAVTVQVVKPVSVAVANNDLNRFTIPVSFTYRSDSIA